MRAAKESTENFQSGRESLVEKGKFQEFSAQTPVSSTHHSQCPPVFAGLAEGLEKSFLCLYFFFFFLCNILKHFG